MHRAACGHGTTPAALTWSVLAMSIHLAVLLNYAWGVLFQGSCCATNVVNPLKRSVWKGDTEEDIEWHVECHAVGTHGSTAALAIGASLRGRSCGQ